MTNKTKGEDILPMKGLTPLLADLTPFFGGNRAGRASQMAQAIGSNVPLSVKYPLSTAMGSAALGTAVGAFTGHPIGMGAGGLAGLAANTHMRRSGMRDIVDKFNKTDSNNIDPQRPDHRGLLSNLFLNLGGSWHKGNVDTYNHLRGVDKEAPHFDTLSKIMGAVDMESGGAGAGLVDGFRGDSTLNKQSNMTKSAQHFNLITYGIKKAGIGDYLKYKAMDVAKSVLSEETQEKMHEAANKFGRSGMGEAAKHVRDFAVEKARNTVDDVAKVTGAPSRVAPSSENGAHHIDLAQVLAGLGLGGAGGTGLGYALGRNSDKQANVVGQIAGLTPIVGGYARGLLDPAPGNGRLESSGHDGRGGAIGGILAGLLGLLATKHPVGGLVSSSLGTSLGSNIAHSLSAKNVVTGDQLRAYMAAKQS